jgi:hypothetical protein
MTLSVSLTVESKGESLGVAKLTEKLFGCRETSFIIGKICDWLTGCETPTDSLFVKKEGESLGLMRQKV